MAEQPTEVPQEALEDAYCVVEELEETLRRISAFCASWVNEDSRVDPTKAHDFVREIEKMARTALVKRKDWGRD